MFQFFAFSIIEQQFSSIMKHKHIQYLKFIFCSEDIDIEFLLEGAGVAGIPWILPGGSVDLLQVKGINLSLKCLSNLFDAIPRQVKLNRTVPFVEDNVQFCCISMTEMSPVSPMSLRSN